MTKKSNRMEIIEHIEEILYKILTSDRHTLLQALQKINGRERGIIDFWAYHVSANYNYTIEDVYDDIEELYEN